jgi:hypothetical protein
MKNISSPNLTTEGPRHTSESPSTICSRNMDFSTSGQSDPAISTYGVTTDISEEPTSPCRETTSICERTTASPEEASSTSWETLSTPEVRAARTEETTSFTHVPTTTSEESISATVDTIYTSEESDFITEGTSTTTRSASARTSVVSSDTALCITNARRASGMFAAMPGSSGYRFVEILKLEEYQGLLVQLGLVRVSLAVRQPMQKGELPPKGFFSS